MKQPSMQRRTAAIVALLIAQFAASESIASAPISTVPDARTVPDNSFILPKNTAEALEARALEGGADEAGKLYRHYSASRNRREAVYWLRIAVENGDPSSIKTYAVGLWVNGGRRNCTRALALTRKLAADTSAPGYADQLDVDLMVKGFSKCVAKAPDSRS